MVRSEMDEGKCKEVRLMKKEEKTYKIWYWKENADGEITDRGFRTKEYKRQGYACRMADKLLGDTDYFYIVSDTDPFVEKCSICGSDIHLLNPRRTASRLSYRVNYNVKNKPSRFLYLEHLCVKCAEDLGDMILKYVCDHGKKEAPND